MKVPPPLKLESVTDLPRPGILNAPSPSNPGLAGTEAFWRSYSMLPLGPQTPSTPGHHGAVPHAQHQLPSWNLLLEIRNQMPQHLALDPRLWSREDVTSFLRWFQREFDLPDIDSDKFAMNGKALSLLTKSDVAARAPGAGDILHNALQVLLHLNPFRMPLSPFPFISPPGSATTPWPPTSQSAHPSQTPLPNHTAETGGNPGNINPHGNGPSLGYHFLSAVNGSSVTLSPAPSTDSQSSSPKHSAGQHQAEQSPPGSRSQAGGGGAESGDSSDERDSAASSESNKQGDVPARGLTGSASAASLLLWSTGGGGGSEGIHSHSTPPSPRPPRVSMAAKERGGAASPRPRGDGVAGTETPGSGGRLLWDFLQQLLNDPEQRYANFIAWKKQDTGVFKINDPAGLAHLWGIQKNHLSMNYDKMSRALRYYYRVNILKKVQGERHCYQFLRNPSELRGIKNISLLRNGSPSSANPPTQPPQANDVNDVSGGDEEMREVGSPLRRHHTLLSSPAFGQASPFSQTGADEEPRDEEDEPTDLSMTSRRNRRGSSASPISWHHHSSSSPWLKMECGDGQMGGLERSVSPSV